MSEAAVDPLAHYITVEEYLEGELFSEERHEYFDGKVFRLTGGSANHNAVAGNFFASIRQHLKGGPCKVYIHDLKVRLKLSEKDLFYYPDVMVACDPTDNHPYYRERPKLIVEVLSKDENKDRVEKLLAYQRLAALEEYVIASQDPEKPEITVFRRGDHFEKPETHIAGDFTLQSIDLTLALDEIYSF